MQPVSKTKEENIVRPSGFTQPSNSMDVPRAGVAKQKRKKRIIMISAVVLGLILATYRPLDVEAGCAERGSLDRLDRYREARTDGAPGARTRDASAGRDSLDRGADGRRASRKSSCAPAARVEPDTILLELTSPEVEQAARDAELQYKAAEAELTTLRATLQRDLLEQESSAARVHSEYQQAKMEAETNDNLAKNGLVADLTHKTSKIKAEDLAARDAIEQKRHEFAKQNIEPQIASKQAAVDQVAALAQLKKDQVEQLKVRAGFTGVLQQLAARSRAARDPRERTSRASPIRRS